MGAALMEQLRDQHREITQMGIDAEELIARLRLSQLIQVPADPKKPPMSEEEVKASEEKCAELQKTDAALEELKVAKAKASEEKWAELQKTEAALEELKVARKAIEEHIRRKAAAMKIDDSCKILRQTGVDARPQ